MQNKDKVKKIVDIATNVLVWLFVLFAILVTILAVSSANEKKIPTIGNTCYLKVESKSMDAKKPDWAEGKPAGFAKGDMLIGEYVYGNYDKIGKLEKGDIITFEFEMQLQDGSKVTALNSHRIIEVNRESSGKIVSFTTQGDNRDVSIVPEEVNLADIVAVYTGKKIVWVGGLIDLVRSPVGFVLVIILPLGLIFIWEVIAFIRTVLKVKNEGKKLITADDEEEIKKRAIEEYLRQQGAALGTEGEKPSETEACKGEEKTASGEEEK